MKNNTTVLISQRQGRIKTPKVEQLNHKSCVVTLFLESMSHHLAQVILQQLITSSRKDFVFLGVSKGRSPVDLYRRGSGLFKAFQAL